MEKFLDLPDTPVALIDGDTIAEVPAVRENQQRNKQGVRENGRMNVLTWSYFDCPLYNGNPM